jgi:aconitate hydratase
MGVLPLQFRDGEGRESLKLSGDEQFTITGVEGGLEPRQDALLTVIYPDGSVKEASLLVRLDTADEVDYYTNGGILHYVLRQMAG